MGYPDNEKLALEHWASSKYAILEGYPIPQWRRGIKWHLPTSFKPYGDRAKTHTSSDFYIRLPDGNTLIVDHDGHVAVEYTKSLEVVWSFGIHGVSGSDEEHLNSPERIDYDYVNDRVLISDTGNDRILEVDHETGEVLNVIDSYDPGTFDNPRALYQHPCWHDRYGDPGDYIAVADELNHYVALIERDGTVVESAGTYGTSGSDLSHLNRPRSVMGDVDYLYVADRDNDRCLVGDPPGFSVEYVYPSPLFHGTFGVANYMIASDEDVAVHMTGDGIRWHNWYAGSKALIPTVREDSFLMDDHFELYEVDYRSHRPYTVYNTPVNIISESLAAGASTDLKVFTGFAWDEIVVKIYSTQDATLDILTILGNRGAETPFEISPTDAIDWRTYDSVPVTGGELESYVITAPSGAMAVQVTMGSTAGTVDGVVEQRRMH